MNDQPNAKQQIVEKIKNSTNILVTVNTNPTVDELVAALGLTLLLNKIKKHATAIVSGDIPPAIDFLEPGKTFEKAVDSLRDFIIALDKEKADHLRYKVDGDVVKIFITPYKTTITSDDLDFSQGDYNVELVLALNVKNRDNLDQALVSHGRILHDATVATISLGEESRLGGIHWQDSSASSLSEMLVALSESLKKGDEPVLDEQIATALLTGIVAATDRFSNNKTNSRIMTMAAQLMAAGANQQLIAAKLDLAEEGESLPVEAAPAPVAAKVNDGVVSMNENEPAKVEHDPAPQPVAPAGEPRPDGTLKIDRDEPPATPADSVAAMAEARLDEQLSAVNSQSVAAPTLSVADLQADIKSANEEVAAAAEGLDTPLPPLPPQPEADSQPMPPVQLDQPPLEAAQPSSEPAISDMWSAPAYEETPTPTFGGTLNATTEAAAEAKRIERLSEKNRTILSHGGKGKYLKEEDVTTGQSPAISDVKPGARIVEEFPAAPPSEPQSPFAAAAEAAGLTSPSGDLAPPAPLGPPPPVDTGQPTSPEDNPTLDELDRQYRGKPSPSSEDEAARAAVEAAYGAVPFTPPAEQPQGQVAPPADGPPNLPMPDFSTLPPLPSDNLPPQPAAEVNKPPEVLGDIFGSPAAQDNPPPSTPEQPHDPTQFRIPGQ